MTLPRRSLMLATLAAPGVARAQRGFPNQPIRFVTASVPGAGTDIIARLVADPMREELGQPVIVENRAGAGVIIAAEAVVRSAPDGYSLLLTAGGLAIVPSVNRNLSFSPQRDLTGVALLASVPLLLVVRQESPLRSLADLLAEIRRRGPAVTYASFGIATPPHLVGERIGQQAGQAMTHVPYRGGAVALPDILTGQVDVGILDAVSMVPHVTSGRLRALAITGPVRSAALPDLPTLSEAGVPFDAVGWQAAFAPARTPPEIVARLNTAFVKALALPRVREAIIAGGSLPIEPPLDPAGWNTRFNRDVEEWAGVARAAHIEVN